MTLIQASFDFCWPVHKRCVLDSFKVFHSLPTFCKINQELNTERILASSLKLKRKSFICLNHSQVFFCCRFGNIFEHVLAL